ncbi:MAG: hypothetical protein K2K30_06205 [Alistipes sp.]|nr:hypothetical protein [Alistipes sp.]
MKKILIFRRLQRDFDLDLPFSSGGEEISFRIPDFASEDHTYRIRLIRHFEGAERRIEVD